MTAVHHRKHADNSGPDGTDRRSRGGRLPSWIHSGSGGGVERIRLRRLLRSLKLCSVCESARCPNLGECWRRGTATFMIMGNVCTRNCAFCAVSHGRPELIQADEGDRVAEAAARLQLRHVVITSVTRDDLEDGGADHFARVVRAVRQRLPGAGIEVLTPDFKGSRSSLRTVTDSRPDVFNHNLETCARLTSRLRDTATYQRSLKLLRLAADLGPSGMIIKSGFMLGLGETEQEVHQLLRDLRDHRVNSVTIGQYLQPGPDCPVVAEYVEPDKFEYWRRTAIEAYGFDHVASGPLVRSSYLAEQGLPQSAARTSPDCPA